jgi:predicted amidophosphoribosyltransferase
VLCCYGDAGWGMEVARGKYETGRFSDALVTAAAGLIQDKWKPDPPPQWVTAVPSEHHAELVRDFAQRLAAQLGLPFVQTLRKHHSKRPQKEMQNSPQQLRNVLRAFEVAEAPALEVAQASRLRVTRGVPPRDSCGPCGETPLELAGETPAPLSRMFQHLARAVASSFGTAPTLPPVPVLLVDDMVDSGWTLTVASVLLQHHGSGPVYPFALAKAAPRGS